MVDDKNERLYVTCRENQGLVILSLVDRNERFIELVSEILRHTDLIKVTKKANTVSKDNRKRKVHSKISEFEDYRKQISFVSQTNGEFHIDFNGYGFKGNMDLNMGKVMKENVKKMSFIIINAVTQDDGRKVQDISTFAVKGIKSIEFNH